MIPSRLVFHHLFRNQNNKTLQKIKVDSKNCKEFCTTGAYTIDKSSFIPVEHIKMALLYQLTKHLKKDVT